MKNPPPSTTVEGSGATDGEIAADPVSDDLGLIA
jgi:hypothetical protein